MRCDARTVECDAMREAVQCSAMQRNAAHCAKQCQCRMEALANRIWRACFWQGTSVTLHCTAVGKMHVIAFPHCAATRRTGLEPRFCALRCLTHSTTIASRPFPAGGQAIAVVGCGCACRCALRGHDHATYQQRHRATMTPPLGCHRSRRRPRARARAPPRAYDSVMRPYNSPTQRAFAHMLLHIIPDRAALVRCYGFERCARRQERARRARSLAPAVRPAGVAVVTLVVVVKPPPEDPILPRFPRGLSSRSLSASSTTSRRGGSP